MVDSNRLDIDVIIPIYKPNFDDLSNCVKSLNNQIYNNFEIFIIEDPSDINTFDFEKKIRNKYDLKLKWIRNERKMGLAESLNIGIKQGIAPYIARVDSDDISLPERFQKQISFLKKNRDISAVGSWMKEFNNNADNKKSKIRKYPTDNYDIHRKIIWYNPIAHPTVMMKREIFNQIGYYKRNLDLLEDWELWFRAVLNNVKIANIPECLVEYQIENNSIVEKNIKQNIENQIKFKKQYVQKNNNFKIEQIALNIYLLKIISNLPERIIKKLYYYLLFQN